MHVLNQNNYNENINSNSNKNQETLVCYESDSILVATENNNHSSR